MAQSSVSRAAGSAKLPTPHTPGYRFLQSFFASWLKLDITQIAAALTIFGTLSGAFGLVKSLGLKVYWWFTRFCTASISIASNDRLNREILNWLGAQVLTRQGTRILTASTEAIQTDAWRRITPTERNDYYHEKRVPIQYLPTFGTTWFILDRNVFLVRRIVPRTTYTTVGSSPDEYADAPKGDEPLVVMCFGRSVAPIKRFLTTCRDFADKQRESFITVRATKDKYHRELWDTTILRPIRPLETVHFDETTRDELVADIRNYLDPITRQFYTTRGIPYRRGYLLHGYPGTGKTSLSLALAGIFGLELYLVHMPSIREDTELEKLFTALPPRCIVLLEDIDAVGINRMPIEEGDEEDEDDKPIRSRCTLSGLLNVLDGVSSQEGRIVLMTSNMAHKLDSALVRPGRIDKMIFLGNISQRSAELMFLRMYAPDASQESMSPLTIPGIGSEELQKLALHFSTQIPEDTFTPAQLQGYLLNRRNSPPRAVTDAAAWIEEEKANMEALKLRQQKSKEYKAKKKEAEAVKLLNRRVPGGVVPLHYQPPFPILPGNGGAMETESSVSKEATPASSNKNTIDGVAAKQDETSEKPLETLGEGDKPTASAKTSGDGMTPKPEEIPKSIENLIQVTEEPEPKPQKSKEKMDTSQDSID